MTTSNEDMQDFFVLNLSKVANWRRLQAKRWPSDTRNTTASERLFALAANAGPIPDDLFQAIEPAFNRRDEKFAQIINETSRAVAFRTLPRTFEDFVRNVANELAVTA